MENFNNFQDLLDGSLTDLEEKELYSILSTDSNIRSEFKNLLKFQKAMDKSRLLSVVPLESEKAIFSTLAIGTATAVPSTAFLTTTGMVMKYVGIATIGALVSAFVFFGFADKFGYVRSNTTNHNNNELTSNKIPDLYSNYFSMTNNNKLTSDINKNISSSQIKKIAKKKTNKIIEKQIINRDDITIQKESISMSEPLTQINSYNTYKVKNDNYSLISNKENSNINKDDINSFGISAELQSMQTWFDTQTKAAPDKIAPFHNMMFSIYYEPIDDLLIGFNLRNETFYEDFTGKDEIGQQTWVEQQPNFTTYSIILKYNSQYEIFKQLKPNFSIAFGFNSNGNVARLGAGVGYEYNDVISFLFGFEYSGMLYKYQNSNFLTNKYAINYGISFKIK